MTSSGKARRLQAPFAAVVALCLLAVPAVTSALADSVSQSVAGGYGRILFTLDPPENPVAAVKDGVLTISFARKVTFSPQQIASGLDAYISLARVGPDGRTFRFALVQPVRLHSSVSADRYALDLVPQGFAGEPPNLPPPPPPAPPKPVDVAKLPPLPIRAGSYANFTRLVFDWHEKVPYTVFPGAGRITIRFQTEARPDFRVLDRIAPPWVKRAGWRIEGHATVIDFNTESDSGYHDFRDGNRVVLDILAPKTDASAYDPPGGAKGAKLVLLQQAGVSAAQGKAVMAAAQKLDGKSASNLPQSLAKPKPQPSTQVTPAQTAPATSGDTKTTATPTSATPATATATATDTEADARRTQEGANLNFPGAGGRNVAAFIRGTTAWIVIDGPQAIDPVRLKTELGDFPASVDVSSGDGVSVLRIGLKSAEQIAARARGTMLEVVLAPRASEQAADLDFVRDDDDPGHAALTTLVPGAHHAVTLADPSAGDALIVVPGAAGHALLDAHRYMEFAALPSAAGLVLTPFADDLSVTVTDGQVTVTRPGGLTLTRPRMPAVDSPAALARGGDGPSYVNFAEWANPGKGSFLQQERMLRDNTARLPADQANPARLALARFYIANQFSAEALGMVNLMQAFDPSLDGDVQLQTIKAAADVMMGRYNDAHNVLSSSVFDNDRHAALWRGLADAGLENWDEARLSLLKAEPVFSRYPPDWQARARIALAEASLHTGALEAADTSLKRLPKDMPQPLFLAAERARAQFYAADGRYRDAHVLFAAVEKGPDEYEAAHAIYDDVTAGQSAGAISEKDAINRLEELRYRWRGDALELKTLRKLGALYFGEKRWRDGLQTLRIATQTFPNNDMARAAQDDMRHAFETLFLKGAADKLPPIQALALFYDFIDLTPIGADGDEMIRRMADRLVAVDLLGPAETLLKYQVDKRLDGIARAQVATRLAMIDLMDHKAKDALAAIRTTSVAGLPDDIGHARLLLEARALAALKQWDEATSLIAVDNAPDTRRLRADIYWESGNWAVAGQKTEDLLGDIWQGSQPLTTEQRQYVMRAAIAYSLANDETSLDRLRDHFAAKMKASPDASAFAVVTQRIDMQGVAFRDVAGKIASIDTLESFMTDFKTKFDKVATN